MCNASYYVLINKREPETHVAILYTVSGNELIQIVLEKDEWWQSPVPRIDQLLDPKVSSKAQPSDIVIHDFDVKRGRTVNFHDKNGNIIAEYPYNGPSDLNSIGHHLRGKVFNEKVDYDWILANQVPIVDHSTPKKTKTCIVM